MGDILDKIDRRRNDAAIKYVRSELRPEDLYGQLAEECCELAQAALKMQRILLERNPTDKSEDAVLESIVEEATDVMLCLDMLKIDASGKDAEDIYREKLDRWRRRIAASRL